jgi:hypothetical protein
LAEGPLGYTMFSIRQSMSRDKVIELVAQLKAKFNLIK